MKVALLVYCCWRVDVERRATGVQARTYVDDLAAHLTGPRTRRAKVGGSSWSMRRATSDAHTIIVSVGSEAGGGEVHIVTTVTPSGRKSCQPTLPWLVLPWHPALSVRSIPRTLSLLCSNPLYRWILKSIVGMRGAIPIRVSWAKMLPSIGTICQRSASS